MKKRKKRRKLPRSNIIKGLKRQKLSEILKKAFPYMIFGYLGNKFCYAFRLTTDKNLALRLVNSLGKFGQAFSDPMPSFNGYRDYPPFILHKLYFLSFKIFQ